MTYEDYLLHAYYLIDSELESLNLPRLRQRGPLPRLHDSEVITMEVVGEFLGIDTDKGIWAYFRRHHFKEFPMLARTDRTSFARQAASLWRIKQLLQERLVALLPTDQAAGDGPLWLIDSFPLRVCRFKRAPGHKLFCGLGAAFGRDPTGERLFFGFRVHLRCTDRGFCAAATLAPGNVADWPMVQELLPQPPSRAIGDRNYWNPDGRQPLQNQGLELLAPFRKESSDPMPRYSAMLTKLRQIIEPVIGQLAQRFHCQRTWARDLWHLCSRLARKFLSHSLAVLLNWRAGNPPLQLNLLITN
ncbi:MAG TPA: IS982 family transposase [Tepidisphaeraceae bacterium]|jgi:hypothetical protein